MFKPKTISSSMAAFSEVRIVKMCGRAAIRCGGRFGNATSSINRLLRVYLIDVEQADSTLIVSPSSNSLLIDTGLGTNIASWIKAAMDRAGVSRIDHLVTTHYHQDHYGGVPGLLSNHNVMVVNAYDRGARDTLGGSTTNAPVFSVLDHYRAPDGRSAPRRNNLAGPIGDRDVRGLQRCRVDSTNTTAGADENDNSVALLIQFGEFRYFTGGDIETSTETKLAALDVVQDVDALKASHHGSDTALNRMPPS